MQHKLFVKENEKVKHLRSVMSIDRTLASQLRREVDHLDKDLRQLQETDVTLEQLLSKDLEEIWAQGPPEKCMRVSTSITPSNCYGTPCRCT